MNWANFSVHRSSAMATCAAVVLVCTSAMHCASVRCWCGTGAFGRPRLTTGKGAPTFTTFWFRPVPLRMTVLIPLCVIALPSLSKPMMPPASRSMIVSSVTWVASKAWIDRAKKIWKFFSISRRFGEPMPQSVRSASVVNGGV